MCFFLVIFYRGLVRFPYISVEVNTCITHEIAILEHLLLKLCIVLPLCYFSCKCIDKLGVTVPLFFMGHTIIC